MNEAAFDRAHAALLVMDFQTQIIGSLPEDRGKAVIENVAGAVDVARNAKLPVIFVMVQYRAGYPDASSRNKRVSMLADAGMLNVTDPASGIHERLTPRDIEPIVVKRRVSALTDTDLAPLLSAMEISTLVLAGVTTSGVVLSTVRQAADMDYRMVVLEDCCADRDDEVHRILAEQIFPTQAEVWTAEDLASRIG